MGICIALRLDSLVKRYACNVPLQMNQTFTHKKLLQNTTATQSALSSFKAFSTIIIKFSSTLHCRNPNLTEG